MADLFDKAEISQLHRRFLLNEHVLWFNVSMEESVAMDVIQGRSYLLDDMTDLFVRERIVIEFTHLHHAIQVHVQQLKHHVKGVLVSDHLQTSDYILVLEADHCFDFGVSHGCLPGCKLSLEGLECVNLFGLFVSDLVDDAKAAFAECFEHSETVDQQCACCVRLCLRVCCHVYK